MISPSFLWWYCEVGSSAQLSGGWWYPGEGVITPRWPPPRRWINKPSYLRYEPLFTALSLWCTLRLSPTPLRLRSWARSRARFNGQAPLRLTKLSLPLSWCFVRERREYQPEGPNVKPSLNLCTGSLPVGQRPEGIVSGCRSARAEPVWARCRPVHETTRRR